MSSSASYSQAFWKRLKKNKGAMLGLIIICLAFALAISAYLVAPDSTPNANKMTVEIGGRKPGFTMLFLKFKNDNVAGETSFISWLINGREEPFVLLPITSYEKASNQISVQKFIDDGITESQTYPLSKIEKGDVVSKTFVLGTDKFGRDILSRLIVGTRVSLSVGMIAVTISVLMGILMGSLAGYFGGWIDDVVMWFVNVIWSIPTLLLVFALTLLLGKGFWQVFVAVGFTMWVNVARLVRGQILVVRELEYIEATRALGYSHTRTIVHHILPNILGPVMVIAASNFASAIVIEAGLSFLGVGVQPPQPSWGLMIKENYNFIITHNPMLALAPGIAIMILVLAFNLLGNGLRDAMNVRGKL